MSNYPNNNQETNNNNQDNPELTQEKLNKVLTKLSEVMSCNSKWCKKQKEKVLLEEKYLQAKLNAKTAPTKLQNSERNLLLFTSGTQEYNNYLRNKYEKEAYRIAEKTFNQNFQDELSDIFTNLKTLQSLLTNYDNVYELYDKITKENVLLKKDIQLTTGVIITNTRKSVYENQVIDDLQYWTGWFKFFYLLIIVGYVIGLILLPWEVPKRNYILFFILICIYPFFIPFLEKIEEKISFWIGWKKKSYFYTDE